MYGSLCVPHYMRPRSGSPVCHRVWQGWNLEVDVQDASGTVSYEFLFSFFSNVYTNVTNIVVRVSPASLSEAAKENALLVSSHFDSTLGTPGAADDAVAIAGVYPPSEAFALCRASRVLIMCECRGAFASWQS